MGYEKFEREELMSEQRRTVRRAFALEEEKLQQIADTLADLGPSQEKFADDLYNRAISIMIGTAPTHLHTIWHLIEMRHLSIQTKFLMQLINGENESELTPEEEQLYQKAINDL